MIVDELETRPSFKVEVEVFATDVYDAAWNAQQLWNLYTSLPYVTVTGPDGVQHTFDMDTIPGPGNDSESEESE